MNQELLLLRGEYMTLQVEQKKREAEVQALASSARQALVPFASYSRRALTEPRPALRDIEQCRALLERLEALVQISEADDQRIKELKPLANI